MKAPLVVVALTMAAASVAQETPVFHPAHWVGGDKIEPTYHAFSFYSLAFTSPDRGWIVGDKYLLHIEGETLEVAFLDLWDSLYTVSFSGPDFGWIGGNGPPNGRFPLLRHGSEGWKPDRVEGMVWAEWSISEIWTGRAGDGWAVALVNDDRHHEGVPKRSRRITLRYEDSSWRVDGDLVGGYQGVEILDACQTPTETWWFVGHDRSAPRVLQAFVGHWDGSTLVRERPASTDAEYSTLSKVRCPADGSVWALGEQRATKDAPREVLLIRHVMEWQRVTVATELPGDAYATSLAPIDANEVWLSANCGALQVQCRERFFHYRDGNWQTVELPFLPGGRSTHAWIVDTQFVSRTEGWAIASDLKPRSGGRIFHYRDGQWRNRNWNWHFWNAPGFGLFGY